MGSENIDPRRFYVYGHFKKDTDGLFYIGKGFGSRKTKIKCRSRFWHNIANKHGIAAVELYKNLTETEAVEKEKELIAFYGRADLGLGPLVNHTDGGEGTVGHIKSPETIERVRQKSIGRKHTEEFKRNVSLRFKGRRHSEEIKAKMRGPRPHCKWTDEQKLKFSLQRLGRKLDNTDNMTRANQQRDYKNPNNFKGVSKRPNGKFIAQIQYKMKKYTLGFHSTVEEAARAYDKKALELFGETANLNFPLLELESCG